MEYSEPEVYKKSFTCPNCYTVTQHTWWDTQFTGNRSSTRDLNLLRIGTCSHCKEVNIWIGDKMFYPDNGSAPEANVSMPPSVFKLYNEASIIMTKSPRGAAALLRLAIQVLCKELGENGENINKDIASLVKKGLPDLVQQSLDIVRVTGNDAVHPGQIDTDDPETVNQLFELINVIVEYMIALPNKVSGLYKSLPQGKIEGIKVRDSS